MSYLRLNIIKNRYEIHLCDRINDRTVDIRRYSVSLWGLFWKYMLSTGFHICVVIGTEQRESLTFEFRFTLFTAHAREWM